MTRRTIAGVFVALLAAMPAAELLAGDGQRGRGAGGSGRGTDSPSRYVIAGHVVDQAKRLGVTIDWRTHARVGIPVTLATLAVAAAWLAILGGR